MKKRLTILFSAVIVISLVLSVIAFTMAPEQPDINLTIVRTPDQTESQWPDAIPDPMAHMIALPDGTNLAEGRPVAASSFTDVYIPSNAVDGVATSYWESQGLPADFTIELDGTHTIETVAVRLNPSLVWEARSQAFEIFVSDDGENFTSIMPNQMHDFDPATGNTVRVDFAPVSARFVRLNFTANTAARTEGAQAAEIMVW